MPDIEVNVYVTDEGVVTLTKPHTMIDGLLSRHMDSYEFIGTYELRDVRPAQEASDG